MRWPSPHDGPRKRRPGAKKYFGRGAGVWRVVRYDYGPGVCRVARPGARGKCARFRSRMRSGWPVRAIARSINWQRLRGGNALRTFDNLVEGFKLWRPAVFDTPRAIALRLVNFDATEVPEQDNGNGLALPRGNAQRSALLQTNLANLNTTPAKLIRRRLLAVGTPAAVAGAAKESLQDLRLAYKAALDGAAAPVGGAVLGTTCEVAACHVDDDLQQFGEGVAMCAAHAARATAALAAADPDLAPGHADFIDAVKQWAEGQSAPATVAAACIICTAAVATGAGQKTVCAPCLTELVPQLRACSFRRSLSMADADPSKPYFTKAVAAVKAKRGGGGQACGSPAVQAGEEKCCVGCGGVADLDWGSQALDAWAPGLVALCVRCRDGAIDAFHAATPGYAKLGTAAEWAGIVSLARAHRKGERVVANMARPPATPGGPQLAGTPSGVQTKEDLLRQAADLAVAARAASLEAQAEAKARLKIVPNFWSSF